MVMCEKTQDHRQIFWEKIGAYSAKLNINLALGVFSCVGLKERFGILCKQKSIWHFFHLKMLP